VVVVVLVTAVLLVVVVVTAVLLVVVVQVELVAAPRYRCKQSEFPLLCSLLRDRECPAYRCATESRAASEAASGLG